MFFFEQNRDNQEESLGFLPIMGTANGMWPVPFFHAVENFERDKQRSEESKLMF